MDDLDQEEWLLTNGLGGFAAGTVSDARTALITRLADCGS